MSDQLGNKDSRQLSYGNQSNILRSLGRVEDAVTLLNQKEIIRRDLENKPSLAYC